MSKENKELPEEPPVLHKFGLDEDSKIKYEELLVNLNRELSRLRSLVAECEKKEIECKEHNADKLIDYDDIIIYLTRTIGERSEELAGLEEEKRELEKIRDKRHDDYEQEIADMENEYYGMVTTLTDENVSLSNKVLSYDRINIEREAFFTKWQIQEDKLEAQYYRHKQEIYDLEKWVIIQKNNLKIDIAQHMSKLVEDLDNATELRLASLSYQLIKQNIVSNNFMKKMLHRFENIYASNTKLRNENNRLNAMLSSNNLEYTYCIRQFKHKMHTILQLITLFENEYAIDRTNKEFFKYLKFYVKKYIPSVEDMQKMQMSQYVLLSLIEKEQEKICEMHTRKCGLLRLHANFRIMIKKTHKELMELFDNKNLPLKWQNALLLNVDKKLKEVFTNIRNDEIMRSGTKINIKSEKKIQTTIAEPDSVHSIKKYESINY